MKLEINSNIEQILTDNRNIAVVGLSNSPARASNQVARYLQKSGYNIYPVNPGYTELLGLPCYPDLQAIPGPVDIVDIFRRPEFVPEIVDAAIEIGAKVIWMQLGVIHEASAQRALDAGLQVVMDHCLKIEHRHYYIATKK